MPCLTQFIQKHSSEEEGVIMTDSEELKRVVERLLRESNVKLTDSIQNVLQRIAREFWAAGLIAKETADNMHVTGVGDFSLASKLLNACHSSLV